MAAQTGATQALADAFAANTAATTADGKAVAAQTGATQALADAFAANTAATTADGKAVAAQGTADTNALQLFTVEAKADGAQATATQAQTDATQALANAATAQVDATDAYDLGLEAWERAGDGVKALQDLPSVEAKADGAQATATQAQTTATQAQTDATNADNRAVTAQNMASTAQTDATNALTTANQTSAQITQLSTMRATSTADPINITFAPFRIFYDSWVTTGPSPPVKIDQWNFGIPGPNRKWIVQCGGDFAAYPSGASSFQWEKDDVEIPGSFMVVFDTHSGASGTSTEYGSHLSIQFVVEADAAQNTIVWKCSSKGSPNTNVRRPYVFITEIL